MKPFYGKVESFDFDTGNEFCLAVHRGMRLEHGRVMTCIAAADPADEAEMAAAISQLATHLAACRRMHDAPAEARLPAWSLPRPDRATQLRAIAAMEDEMTRFQHATGHVRRARFRDLGRRFAVFVAEDLLQMDLVESAMIRHAMSRSRARRPFVMVRRAA